MVIVVLTPIDLHVTYFYFLRFLNVAALHYIYVTFLMANFSFRLVQLVHSSYEFYTLQPFGLQLEVVLKFGKHNTPSKMLNK